MGERKNDISKKSVITTIFLLTAAIASLYLTKVYSDVRSTRLILTNEYQTYSE